MVNLVRISLLEHQEQWLIRLPLESSDLINVRILEIYMYAIDGSILYMHYAQNTNDRI